MEEFPASQAKHHLRLVGGDRTQGPPYRPVDAKRPPIKIELDDPSGHPLRRIQKGIEQDQHRVRKIAVPGLELNGTLRERLAIASDDKSAT